MTTCILFPRTIGPVAIDVVVSESITSSLEIAKHPVESGAQISDHAWRKPYQVELAGAVGQESAIAAYNSLLALQESVEPFDLLTGLKLFNNMLIERLQPMRDITYGRVLNFTATLSEVIIVSSAEGDVAERGQVQARKVGGGNDAQSSRMGDSLRSYR